MFENGGRMDDAGAWGYYNLTEPNGSGELKTSFAEFEVLKWVKISSGVADILVM